MDRRQTSRNRTGEIKTNTERRALIVYVPTVSKAQVMALAAGDAWLDQGACCLAFGPPGTGKTHLASAIGLALVENGRRVLMARTTDLVQRLQTARRELTLEHMLARLDRFHLLILDDFAYVRRDQRPVRTDLGTL